MKKPGREQHRFQHSGFLLLLIVFLFTSCIFDPPKNESLLERLQKYQYVSVDFGADIESNNEILSFSSCSVDNSPPLGVSNNWPIEWDGTSFSVSFDYDWELFSGERVHSYGSISGKLSDDGETIESLTAQETSDYPDLNDVYKDFMTVINVPYNPDYQYDEYSPRFSVEGPLVSNHMYSYSQSWDFLDGDGNPQQLYATTVNYNDPDDEAYIYITFSGD